MGRALEPAAAAMPKSRLLVHPVFLYVVELDVDLMLDGRKMGDGESDTY